MQIPPPASSATSSAAHLARLQKQGVAAEVGNSNTAQLNTPNDTDAAQLDGTESVAPDRDPSGRASAQSNPRSDSQVDERMIDVEDRDRENTGLDIVG